MQEGPLRTFAPVQHLALLHGPSPPTVPRAAGYTHARKGPKPPHSPSFRQAPPLRPYLPSPSKADPLCPSHPPLLTLSPVPSPSLHSIHLAIYPALPKRTPSHPPSPPPYPPPPTARATMIHPSPRATMIHHTLLPRHAHVNMSRCCYMTYVMLQHVHVMCMCMCMCMSHVM